MGERGPVAQQSPGDCAPGQARETRVLRATAQTAGEAVSYTHLDVYKRQVVTNPEHRKHAEAIWKLPPGTINPKVGYHAVEQNRALKDGKLNAYWVMVNNNMQAAANLREETWPGYRLSLIHI